MLTRAHRFHGRNSLRGVYQNGKTARSPLVALKYMPSQRADYRTAVVVSRKVHKSAVARNRIRRRVYEAVRHLEPQGIGTYDLVFTIFSEQLLELSGVELDRLIRKLLQQAGVIQQ
jgi:ribonuclease P protein component